MNIGSVVLPHGLALAPMAGVSDRSFRQICRRFGAEYTVSEMVSAKALCYEQRGNAKKPSATVLLAAVEAEELPMAVQLFGHEPDVLAEAARMLETGEYRGCRSTVPPSVLDLNMGCPVRKITANGEGSALMRNPRLAGELIRAVCRAVSIPVTVKIRAGWDAEHLNASEMAKIAEDAGAAAVCVHGRTREEMYFPGIRMEAIAEVKRSVSIPVFGNGDIRSADDALAMMRQTGCDGVMIGRGAMGNPWIFAEIQAAMAGKPFTPPTFEERRALAMEHLAMMTAHKGDATGTAEAKKHMARYLSGMRGAADARAAVMNARSAAEIEAAFDRLANGEEKESAE